MPPLRSLRAISLAFVAALSLATVLTGIAIYFALIDSIDRAVDKRLGGEAHELLEGQPGATVLAGRITRESAQRESGDIGYLLEQDGRRLVGNIAPLPALPPGYSTVRRDTGIPGLTRGRALVFDRSDGTRLTLIAESEPIDRHDHNRVAILIGGCGTILLVLVAGTVVLTFTIRRNIEVVRTAAEAIVEGDLRRRVPVAQSSTAFGRQAEAFNHMLDRIEELMASLRNVSDDIAHDLRTPLARLRGRLAAVAASPEAAPVRPALEEAIAESEDMLAMFAAILRIAEVEGGARRARFEEIDLAALAEEVAESLEAMVTASGRTLAPGPWQSARVQGDRRLLTQLVVNLVENAVNHTPVGSAIAVTVTREGQEAILSVTDNGPGIAEADRALALRRFGRIDKSRNGAGHGLGLPLVQAVARLHHGQLELTDARPGLRASVRLPLDATSE